ncbi:DUF1273 domain-containing protein [Peribacillus alkalitolerans]|uniref:DUF1273 domain-containing protein n=1 Tax=Peribacillus alkalitolerans TaxID=1550385 RepID=UPI0013D17B0F|nr:DUF1273 domain-containing protein [Peribacillus alkalitolerans]
MKVLYLTGYKAFELGIFKNNHEGVHYIKKAIRHTLIALIEDGLEWVLVSGQLGVELWAAEEVLALRKQYPQLQLAVLTPHFHQEEKWNEQNKEYYHSILNKANFVDSISKKPYENPMQLRMKNHFLLNKSDALLIVYDDERPGSPRYTYDDAKKHNEKKDYPIYQITFYDLQQQAESFDTHYD